ncbi:hypothetical protein DFH07DRAFT_785290 [Mycena maculata]|uniref:Uncharacterized protein n=1 Tax=Mycena maculata TaxID=230809 RepID=A0AAD7HBE4_9AGAR|nr:hypothetical protein DFH07DRAFT_785290 [Mycena maculata]
MRHMAAVKEHSTTLHEHGMRRGGGKNGGTQAIRTTAPPVRGVCGADAAEGGGMVVRSTKAAGACGEVATCRTSTKRKAPPCRAEGDRCQRWWEGVHRGTPLREGAHGGTQRREGARRGRRAACGGVVAFSASNKRKVLLCWGAELECGARGLEVVPSVDVMQGDGRENSRSMRRWRDCAIRGSSSLIWKVLEHGMMPALIPASRADQTRTIVAPLWSRVPHPVECRWCIGRVLSGTGRDRGGDSGRTQTEQRRPAAAGEYKRVGAQQRRSGTQGRVWRSGQAQDVCACLAQDAGERKGRIVSWRAVDVARWQRRRSWQPNREGAISLLCFFLRSFNPS